MFVTGLARTGTNTNDKKTGKIESGPLYYKEVLTRFYLEFFYPHDSERECDRTIGSFSHQSEITREQLSLPLASPPSPPGIRGILWVVQSIDLWRVS